MAVTSSVASRLPSLNPSDDLPQHVTGSLIINADDWGRDVETTDRILECVIGGTVSSTSAMVFMEDSVRGAGLAGEKSVDCGLHLNFTTAFSAPDCPVKLKDQQERLVRYLRGNRLAQAVYHPGLASTFRYVVMAQIEEFQRLFGIMPRRLDGHHHMHLCANVLLGGLLPPNTQVRRNFSFRKNEKSILNRLYRAGVDRMLAKRHRLTDYFFSLPPLSPTSRIDEIFRLAQNSVVEVETHPVNQEEYRFLTRGDVMRSAGKLSIARGFKVPVKTNATSEELRKSS